MIYWLIFFLESTNKMEKDGREKEELEAYGAKLLTLA